MKTICKSLLCLMLLLALAATALAQDTQEVETTITVTGYVTSDQDGLFLDDGDRVYLLLGMSDSSHEGLMVEVYGTYVMVDEQPAIQVQEIVVIEEGSADSAEEASSADAN